MAVKLTLVHVIAVSTVVTVGFLLMYWKMRGLERSVAQAQASAQQALALAQEAHARLQTEGASCEAEAEAGASNSSRDAELVRSVVTEDPCAAEDGMSVCSADVDEVLRSLSSGCVPSPGSAASSEAEALSLSPSPSPEAELSPPEDAEDAEVAVPSSRGAHEDEFTLSFAQKGESIEDELRKKTLEELRALLKSMNLSAKGNKAELIARALSASA